MFKKFITLISSVMVGVIASGCNPSTREVYHQQPVYVQSQPQHVYETRRPFFSFSRVSQHKPIKRTIFKTKKVYINKTVVVNKYYSKSKRKSKRR